MKPESGNYFVFLVHGREKYFHECLLALLSLCRATPDAFLESCTIVLYTDDPEYFLRHKMPFRLHIERLEPAAIKDWQGGAGYIHRVKTAVLADVVTKLRGNFIFLDTDVWMLQSPQPLFERIASGDLYMHVMEGTMADTETIPFIKKAARFFSQNAGLKINGAPLGIDARFEFWNSGLMGFESRNEHLFQSMLAFTDTIHPLYKKHITEQLAVSYYFGKAGRIHNASAYVLHYWSLSELGPLLGSFFRHFSGASWIELMHYCQLVQLPVLMQDKASFFINRSIAGKFAKQRYEPSIPDWSLLSGQL